MRWRLLVAGGLAVGALVLPVNGLAAPTREEAAALEPPLRHWIGIRTVGGHGEFYDRRTGRRFVPRGANYLKLEPDAEGTRFDVLLDPRKFDKAQIRRDLLSMRAQGYNTIRIFLDLCRFECIGNSKRLNPAFLDNLATLLRVARDVGMFVLPNVNEIDVFFSYRAKVPCCEEYDGSFNALFLSSEGLKAARAYYTDVITGLKKRRAPLEVILGWSLRNEQFFNADHPPLTLDSGMLTTANGKTYDLSDPAAKERMLDENLLHFIAKMRTAIRKVDPGALVTIGAHPPTEVAPTRVIRMGPVIARSTADFFDFHLYPGVNVPRILQAGIEALGLAGYDRKPVVMGEYGAFTFNAPTPRAAARLLEDWQVESCRYGIDGWLLWLWASNDAEVWGGLDGGGIVNRILAPKERPDPCAPGSGNVRNLAAGRPVTASQGQPDHPPADAVDSIQPTWWNAGALPPQWIEVDLGAPSRVSEIDLLLFQFVEGPVTYRIQGRTQDGTLTLLEEISRATADNQWLVSAAGAAWEGITAVRIETVSGPAFAAWREIQVLGTQGG